MIRDELFSDKVRFGWNIFCIIHYWDEIFGSNNIFFGFLVQFSAKIRCGKNFFGFLTRPQI